MSPLTESVTRVSPLTESFTRVSPFTESRTRVRIVIARDCTEFLTRVSPFTESLTRVSPFTESSTRVWVVVPVIAIHRILLPNPTSGWLSGRVTCDSLRYGPDPEGHLVLRDQ